MTITMQKKTTTKAITHKAQKISTPAQFYASLDASVAADAKAAEKRMKKHMLATRVSIFEIGRDLLDMKAKMDHGQWGKWLKVVFDMSDRTAQRYMAVAERFADKQEALKLLPVGVIHVLAAPSTPEGFAEAVMIDVMTGTMPAPSQASIKTLIAGAKKDAGTKVAAASTAKETVQSMTAADAAVAFTALLKKRLGTAFPKAVDLFQQSEWKHVAEAFDAAMTKEAA